ncbi:MAG: hypothetical protein R2824_11815 [Saprospiraceae bacterium]|nr:hypothetical protein [Lewinella sp.]
MDISLQLAAIIGPVLMAVSLSEYLHYEIWKNVHPTLVQLNGLIFFTGGLILVNLHNIWIANWAVIITVISWLLLAAGLFRMFFPTNKQLPKSRGTDVFLLVLFLVGGFLSVEAYLMN